MPKLLVPSLSEDSWIDNSLQTFSLLFSHIFLSDYSQSYLYRDNITSLSYIIQKGQGNIPTTINNIKNALTMYFSRYFSDVIVDVVEATEDNSSHAKLSIYVSVTDSDNKSFSLGKIITIENLLIKEIIDINNS